MVINLSSIRKCSRCITNSTVNKTIRTVLIDLCGTLHVDDLEIPGTIEALKKLRKTDLKIKFVTNTTRESRRILHNRLTKLGFILKSEEIHSSLEAARCLIIKRKLKPFLLLAPEALEDFEGVCLKEGQSPNAVVVGLAPTELHYDRLNEAFRVLINGAELIGIHAGRYYKRYDGFALGPGCFVKGLEYAAHSKAELVGKPNETFFKSALDSVAPENAVMIGDDIIDDIEGAMRIGMKGYLVKTGNYLRGDENRICPHPTAVCNSFVEAVDKILNECI